MANGHRVLFYQGKLEFSGKEEAIATVKSPMQPGETKFAALRWLASQAEEDAYIQSVSWLLESPRCEDRHLAYQEIRDNVLHGFREKLERSSAIVKRWLEKPVASCETEAETDFLRQCKSL